MSTCMGYLLRKLIVTTQQDLSGFLRFLIADGGMQRTLKDRIVPPAADCS